MPNGSEKALPIDWMYSLDEFDRPSTFASVPDSRLPFQVVTEHMRKSHGNTCDPNRKWRYFYVDALFRSGTHMVIKNNDRDEFNVEELGPLGPRL